MSCNGVLYAPCYFNYLMLPVHDHRYCRLDLKVDWYSYIRLNISNTPHPHFPVPCTLSCAESSDGLSLDTVHV